ncbi:DUF5110 domain-containing protein [Butyrivibrio sp. CB08]|uniref:glycoside hydrolase family 31 protein n=1 Tax=Butyrivibrio sp. CB08 TaxID=2364879 RepID=UPI000EAA51AC|nr:TIM-barrel domain-containing protein [Butyrivibrio sp. CB08]RKM62164.1 DUF5110 domain-containing protein [Butyrivibrio sp. CB08]
MSKVITGDKYRITVLTDRLVRFEYSKEGCFEDRLSRTVVNRDFEDVETKVSNEGGWLTVETDELLLKYDEKPFSSIGLSIELKNYGTTYHYSFEYNNSGQNLSGTVRTLDTIDGSIPLGPGIFGKEGFAVLYDGDSPVFDEELQCFTNRAENTTDFYFFGYGKDYYGGLRDFYKLSGKTPLIPRYALGNWWSRYFKYSEESYKEVVEKFKEEEIPLSVAVIDMDWHLTEVDPKYGTGWTGYTWDKKLFPDYKRFLKMLKDNKLATTLNLHPADGIRAFEDQYERAAKRMGIDPVTEEAVEFDFADEKFRDTYFEELMHPFEDDGVDFWWIDWQQGFGKKPGDVDPLILLNHYHYKDQEKRNKRPMIFSRYAGPGSHRYPIGFSGDTVCSWKSLAFQPYFTSTSSNVGYGWWSHDIGGHMMGDKDDERLIRWIQFGVFSPIMRLHSSCSPFLNKEPWVIDEPYHSAMRKFLRLRHRLVPYLYTENYRAYKEDKPLVRPMYYDHASDEESYRVPNEYGFGESLYVGAITEPLDDKLKLSAVNMLIPEGRYVDLLSGRVYVGGKKRKLYRDIYNMPVLMAAGTILPIAPDSAENGTDNPTCLELVVAAGADGSYTLYEDDGCSMDFEKGAFATTTFECSYDEAGGAVTVKVKPAQGDLSLIPERRDYVITILGAGKKKSVTLESVETGKGAEIVISDVVLTGNDHVSEVFDILERAYIEIGTKDMIYDAVNAKTPSEFTKWLRGADVSEDLKDAILEVFEDM